METKLSSLILGNKIKSNNSFSSLLVGGNRLKDSDKDGVPNIWDCQPYNKKKHIFVTAIRQVGGTGGGNLTSQQQADIKKEAEAYAKAGLKQPTLEEKKSFYGTSTNIVSPTEYAYYSKVETGEITPKQTDILGQPITPLPKVEAKAPETMKEILTPPTTPLTPYLTPTPTEQPKNVVSSWKKEYESQYYQKPISQVGKEFIGIIGKDIKSILSKEEINIVNPLEAFKGYGKREIEIKETQPSPIIKRGTISPGEAPLYTYGELQRDVELTYQADVNKILKKATKEQETYFNEIQRKVDSEKLNVEEANNLLNKKNTEINKELDKDLNKIKKIDYYSKSRQAGENIIELSKIGVETASLFHPATATLMGAYKFSKLPITDEYQYYNPITGTTKTLYPKEKATFIKKAEASAFLVGGMLGALGKARAIEKEIVGLELAQAGEQPIKFKELQIVGKEGKGTKVIMKGESEFRKLKIEKEVAGIMYPQGKTGKAFIMPYGTGEARISGETSWTLFGGGKPTYVAGVQEFEVGAKGITFDLGKGRLVGLPVDILGTTATARPIIKGEAFGTIGTGTAIPTKSTGIFYTTKEVRPHLTFPSPEIKYVSDRQARKIGKQLASELLANYRTGGIISKELTTAQSMKIGKNLYFTATEKGDIGLTKVIYPTKSTGVEIFRSISGKKTPLSKTFQVQEEERLLGLGKIIEKPVSKITKPFVKGIIKTIPTEIISPIYAGIGLIKPTEIKGRLGEGNIPSLTGTGRIKGLGITGKYRDLGAFETRFKGLEGLDIERIKTKTKTKLREKEGLISAGALLTDLTAKPSLREEEATALTQRQREQQQREREKTRQVQEQVFAPISTTAITPRINIPTPAGFGSFGLLFLGGKIKYPEEIGYDAEALIESTKPKRRYWLKLNRKPLTRRSALSESAEYVDNTISARGRIIKSKSKKKPIDTREDYFGINRYKFRTFQQKKGVKTKLPSSFIELQKYRLDKPMETRKIQREKKLTKRTPFGF